MNSRLDSLPKDARVHILHMLGTSDLVSVMLASSALWQTAESGLDLPSVLRRERLPGTTAQELVFHVTKWSNYRQELLHALHDAISPFHPFSSVNGNVAWREFLRGAIPRFVHRIAIAQSWYKHLPLATGQVRLEFFLNETVRIYRKNGSWLETTNGDYTRIHQTWTPMKDDRYRDCFGFFSYRELRTEQRLDLKVHSFANDDVHVPAFALGGEPVAVTAAVHPNSDQHELYEEVLAMAVYRNDPSIVFAELNRDVLPYCQKRFMNTKGMFLPSEVACDLECYASALISRRRSLTTKGSDDQQRAIQTEIASNAAVAVQQQRKREWFALARSLYHLSVCNFGRERVPELQEILRALSRDFKIG